MFRKIILIILFLFSFSLFAEEISETTNKKFEEASGYFDFGKYDECIKIVENLLHDNEIMNINFRLKSYQLLALSNFNLKNTENAKYYIKLIYLIQFDYKFDPVFIPPDFIDFANTVLKKNKKEITKHKDFIEKYRLLKNPKKKTQTPEKYFYKNFVPFGVGQFQNGHSYKGYLIMGVESVVLTINIGSYILLKYYQKDDYTFENKEVATTGKIVNNSSFYIFLGLYVYGVVDSLVYYKATEKIKIIQSNNINLSPILTPDFKGVFFSIDF